MKAAYLVGAVGTGCALALLYLKSWKKDGQTADDSSTGHPEETDEIDKNGTSDNVEEEIKECESHSIETCLENVYKFEECGSKPKDSLSQEKEGCQKSVSISEERFSTVSEDFIVTQSVKFEDLECEENDHDSCHSVLNDNLNCALDLAKGKEDNILHDNADQFCKQFVTPSKQEVPNYDDRNGSSDVFVNETVKKGSELNREITVEIFVNETVERVNDDIDYAQVGNEVPARNEYTKMCEDDLLSSTVEETSSTCRQANNESSCDTLNQQEDNVTMGQLDLEECVAGTRDSILSTTAEILTKSKEDTVQQSSVANILTQPKEDLVEQLNVAEKFTHIEEGPTEKLGVAVTLTPVEEAIIEPLSATNIIKHSESEKESVCKGPLGENVVELSHEENMGKQCKDNENVPLATEDIELSEANDIVEPEKKEDTFEQSVDECLEQKQDFCDAEICSKKAEEMFENDTDDVQSFCEGVKDRNCEQILGDDINCNVIVRNNIDGIETSTAVENQTRLHRDSENHEASTSDLSSASEISEIDKVLEDSASTEVSETNKIHQDSTSDLEQIFSKQVSDSVSIASTDSGQGSCEIEPETFFISTSYPLPPQEYIFYEFFIPQVLVGRLIGKKGAMVNKIRAQTDAHLIILPQNVNRKYKICSVEGTKEQVDAALDMIRKHFPLSRYPDVTLERVNQQPCTQSLEACFNAATLQLELPAGVVSEVQVCSIMSPCQFFVHLPLHPSHGNLARLLHCMNTNYADGSTTPALPQPISGGTVCAALVNGQWQRCMVVSCEENCSLNLLDLGGVVNVPIENLRQIRSDYLTLPFQAAQCILHGVNSATESWSDTTYTAFEELTSDTILFATVVAYTEEGIPFVNLYRRENNEYISINEKLVDLGHAKWVSPVGVVA
ncbi:A-kinase anchor protein spoonbill isoform X2 [Oratosquilla oratoria]